MPPTFTPGDCIKAARSSAGQNCIRVGRKNGWTAIWDDKLATTDTTHDTVLPANQILIFPDDQFDAFQAALRTGSTEGQCLLITRRADAGYVFTAAASHAQPIQEAALHFDIEEFDAFMDGVHQHEFDLERFMTVA
jgi:hypothetical protein